MPPFRRARRARSKKDATPDPRGLHELSQRYLEWMRVQSFSRFTIQTREYELRRFIDWCEERAVVRAVDVTKEVLEGYKRFLYQRRQKDGRPLSRKSQAHLLTAVLCMTKWLERRGLILTNPGASIDLPRIERTLPHPALTSLEVEQVLGAIDVSQPLGLRDRAILEVAYSTGLRRIELTQLKLDHIDPDRGTVMVRHGKGGKDRVVPIGERALAWLTKYLEEVRPFFVGEADEGYVFMTRWGTILNESSMTEMGRRRVEASGLEKPGSLHIYRHSAATGMLEGGADVRVIQEFLGHASLSSTQVYTKVAIQTLKAVHGRTHPAERPPPSRTDPAEE